MTVVCGCYIIPPLSIMRSRRTDRKPRPMSHSTLGPYRTTAQRIPLDTSMLLLLGWQSYKTSRH